MNTHRSVTLSVVLYWCENWHLTLREGVSELSAENMYKRGRGGRRREGGRKEGTKWRLEKIAK